MENSPPHHQHQRNVYNHTPLSFHPPPLPLPAPPLRRDNFSLSPLTPTPHQQFFMHPFPPPTTPTTSASPSSSSSHRKKRSKLLRIDPPGPSTLATTFKTPTRKPDPSAPKITRPCTECGKTFWSWKALFGHMRCHPERQWRGINPPPHLRRPDSTSLSSPPPAPPPTPSSDDQEVAASLLMLAASGPSDVAAAAMRFECASCKKTFGSHQALGGHRASHKNVKGCFAITKSGDVDEDVVIMEGQNEEMGLTLGLGLGHRCSICSKVFPSGQALGGHMRCHWEKSEEQQQPTSSNAPALGPIARPGEARGGLDLNVPALLLEDGGDSSSVSSMEMQLDLRLGI